MRWLFWVFLILSLILHLFLLDIIHLNPDKQEKQKPILVRLVPKQQVKESQPPVRQEVPITKAPSVPPKGYYEKTPLDDGLESKISQNAPAIKKQEPKLKAGSPNEKKTGDGKSAGRKDAPEHTKSYLPEAKAQSNASVPKVSPFTPGSTTSDTQKEKERQRIDDIMHPKDIIEKYAKGGAGAGGEDSVSMEYVKMRYQSYFAKFARRLYQVWVYPEAAGMRGEQGTVQASFIVSRDGSISSIRILRSSGYPDLDNEVMVALKKMYGVPLPDNYDLSTLNVNAYFRYYIGGRFDIY